MPRHDIRSLHIFYIRAIITGYFKNKIKFKRVCVVVVFVCVVVCVCVCVIFVVVLFCFSKSNFMLRYNVWTTTVSQSCRTFVRRGAVTAVQGHDLFTRLKASLYGQ